MTDQKKIEDAAYAKLIAKVEELGRQYAAKYPPKKPTKFYDWHSVPRPRPIPGPIRIRHR